MSSVLDGPECRLAFPLGIAQVLRSHPRWAMRSSGISSNNIY